MHSPAVVVQLGFGLVPEVFPGSRLLIRSTPILLDAHSNIIASQVLRSLTRVVRSLKLADEDLCDRPNRNLASPCPVESTGSEQMAE